MFTDPNLRPQQAWRNGLPTPPDSRGSGSSSPIKAGGRGWDSAPTPEPEIQGSREDMDIEGSSGHDITERSESFIPMTPPLPVATLASDRSLAVQEYPNITPSTRAKPSTPFDSNINHPMTPPLPTHLTKQPIRPQTTPDIIEIGAIDHNPTEAERAIAARLLRTLTGDHQPTYEDINATSIELPQQSIQEEPSTSVLADWIASHTGSSLDAAHGSSAVKKGRERRPLLDRMAPGISKGKGKQVETSTDRDPQVYERHIEDTSYVAGTTKTSSTSTNQPGPAGPTPMDATSIHKATFQVSSSILNLLIAQTHLTSPLHLSGYVIAFAPGHIPFKPKLGELIIALGGVVLGECQVRALRGRRYIIHPIGEGLGGMVDGLEEVDVLGFLEIVGAKIQGSA